MSFIDEIDNILIKAKEEAGSRTQTLERPVYSPEASVDLDDEDPGVVALPSVDELVIAAPSALDPVPPVAVKSAADPQNYIAAVSHAEDIEVRTNSLPEIKPAGKEFFFDNDEPVVF